nr:hypothetical protein [Tanacetum cinerariifolium]
MYMTIDQQVALDEALIPHASRLRIGRSNFRLQSDISSKESTLQLVYDVLRQTPFFKAFLIHWGFYHKRNVDFAYLLLEDFDYQVEHKDTKKSNEMYYPMFTKFGAMLSIDLTNVDIRNSKAYKEYYAVATGATPPKTKASVRKTKSSSDTTVTPPPTATAGSRLFTFAKGKQPAKASKAKSLTSLSEKSSDEGDDDDNVDEGSDDQDSDEEGKEFIHPRLSIHDEEETRDEESFDPIPKTLENTDDEGNGEENLGLNVGMEERQDEEDDEDELYKMLTSIWKEGASTIVAPLPLSAPTLTPSTIFTITTVQQAPIPPTTASSTLLQNLPNFGSLFGFDHRLKTLEDNFSEFVQTNQFAGAVSSIPGIVQRYMDQWMNEAVKVAVQIQSDRLRDEAQANNEEFLKNLDENIQKIIKEQVKEQVNVQVSKILLRIEQTVNEQLEAEILTRTLRWIRPGSKRRREGKEPDSASAPKEKATRSAGKSRQGSKSQQTSASESATAEEPMQTTHEMEEPSHPEFETGVDDQPIAKPSQHPEWFSQQKKPPTLDHDWNKTLPATHESIQPLVELEFFLEEVYKATADQLYWINPEGQQYPHNMVKRLPLIPNFQGRRVILFDYFINNDLEYLGGGALSRKYTTSVTKTKAADYGHIKESARDVYSKRRIIVVTEIKIVEWHNYKHLDWITNVYKKYRNPKACGRPSTQCRKLPEKAQPHKAGYVPDGTLTDVRTALDDRLKGIRMKYLP